MELYIIASQAVVTFRSSIYTASGALLYYFIVFQPMGDLKSLSLMFKSHGYLFGGGSTVWKNMSTLKRVEHWKHIYPK